MKKSSEGREGACAWHLVLTRLVQELNVLSHLGDIWGFFGEAIQACSKHSMTTDRRGSQTFTAWEVSLQSDHSSPPTREK